MSDSDVIPPLSVPIQTESSLVESASTLRDRGDEREDEMEDNEPESRERWPVAWCVDFSC